MELGFLLVLLAPEGRDVLPPAIADALAARSVPFRLRIAGRAWTGARMEEAMAAHLAEGRVEFMELR